MSVGARIEAAIFGLIERLGEAGLLIGRTGPFDELWGGLDGVPELYGRDGASDPASDPERPEAA